MSERRLTAYFYSFDATGVDEIDAVLESVAIAGKAFHHTGSWSEPNGDEPSMVERIQHAANAAAQALRALALTDEEREALEWVRMECVDEIAQGADHWPPEAMHVAVAVLSRLTATPPEKE